MITLTSYEEDLLHTRAAVGDYNPDDGYPRSDFWFDVYRYHEQRGTVGKLTASQYDLLLDEIEWAHVGKSYQYCYGGESDQRYGVPVPSAVIDELESGPDANEDFQTQYMQLRRELIDGDHDESRSETSEIVWQSQRKEIVLAMHGLKLESAMVH